MALKRFTSLVVLTALKMLMCRFAVVLWWRVELQTMMCFEQRIAGSMVLPVPPETGSVVQ
jgi:hypothetical protein